MPGAANAARPRRRALLLLALCVCMTAISGWFFARSLVTPDTGLIRYDPEVTAGVDGIRFSPSSPFTAPLAAGVEPEADRIVSLDSRPVSSTRDLVRAVLAVRSFDPYELGLQREGAPVRTVSITPHFRPARPDWAFELAFCLMLAVAAFALCRRFPRAQFTVPLVLSVLLSMLFTCIMPFSFESTAANVTANAGNISSWLLVIFAMYFPSRRGSRAARALVVGGVVALYTAFCVLRAVLYARWMASGAEGLFSVYRQVGRLVIFSDGVAYGVLAALLARAYTKSRLPRDRRMLQWMLAGVLIAFPPYFFLDQLPLVLGGPFHKVGLGSLAQLFLSILPLFLLLALTRRTAINLKSFLGKYGAWGTLLTLTVVAFAAAYLPLARMFASAYRVQSPIPEALAASLLVIGIGAVRYPVERLFSPPRTRRVEGLQGVITAAGPGSGGAGRLAELRAVVSGIVRTLREPVRLLARSAAEASDSRQREAAAEAEFFLETLGSLFGPSASRVGRSSAEELAAAAVSGARLRFPWASFTLEAGGGPTFPCYAEEVIQALGLLLDNAAEASASPGAEVGVRCSTGPARAVIEITDRGPGLDGEARKRMFKPFWTSKPGHRGLGLYFARVVLERNEGGVMLSAGPSGGTVATVSFPLEPGETT